MKKFCITLRIWLSLCYYSSSSSETSSSAVTHWRESSPGCFMRRSDWQMFYKCDNISCQNGSAARLWINLFIFLITCKILVNALRVEFIFKKEESKFCDAYSREGFSLRSRKLVLLINLSCTECKWDIARTTSFLSYSL